jgi:hypothetical protein
MVSQGANYFIVKAAAQGSKNTHVHASVESARMLVRSTIIIIPRQPTLALLCLSAHACHSAAPIPATQFQHTCHETLLLV